MEQLQSEFMGHVTINGRIYEIVLEEIGTAQESLTINGCVCTNYPMPYLEEHLKKRSIWIENYMVHFVNIHGKITTQLESLSEGKTSLEERKNIPQYEGPMSRKFVNEEYLKNMPSDHLRVVNHRLRDVFSFVFIGAYWLSLLYLNEAQCKTIFIWILVLFFIAEVIELLQESKYWLGQMKR